MKGCRDGRTTRSSWLGAACAIALALCACRTPVGVREIGFDSVYRDARQNALDEEGLSRRGRMLLAYLGLEEQYRLAPAEAVAALTEVARQERVRSLHVAIAEMHYDIALDDGDPARFLAAAIHAYIYLFGEGFGDEPSPYARQFRMACDLYNSGLAQALRAPSGEVLLQDGVVRTPVGDVDLRCTRPGFPWDESEFPTFLPADAFEVRGLRERVRWDGLGMPLIAVQSAEGAAALSMAHVGGRIKLPATAFMRLHGGLEELRAGELRATLELYLSTDVPLVEVAGREVPLETDLTTPLAYSLEESDVWSFGLRGFLEGRLTGFEQGVRAMWPYQEEKIPLVLIHGTASSPAAWAQTINGLLADRRIGSRYQVWLALYNTGNPILYSASVLRESLQELCQRLDPEGDDAALARMVLVGHSQGGLIARLLTSSSGDSIWQAVTDVPFEEYPLSQQNRDLLRPAVYFEPLPFVERVVFLSTPHAGSIMASGSIGRFARRLVSIPSDLVDMAQSVLVRSDLPPELRRLHTSIENMEPDSRFMRGIARLEFGEQVVLNSIIAVKPGQDPVEQGNDGVVEYASAHLDRAQSELVVRHGHSCQGTSEVIGELRRILLRHLEAAPDGGAP